MSKLKRKLRLAEEDFVRINKRLDEAQGMFQNISFMHVFNMKILSQSSFASMCMIAGSAAAVETIVGELAQAKQQARVNKVAADKAAEDLKSQQVVCGASAQGPR